MSTATAASTTMDTGESMPAMQTIRRGIELSPELTDGLRGTLAFAVLSTLGRIVVPVAVQQVIDKGVNAPDGPDLRFVGVVVTIAAVAVLVTSLATYKMTYRLFTSAERGLATLRTKAFRHVHDLPLLTQNTERRGALVSRVTSDVDQVSQFLVFGGIISIVSVGQVVVATEPAPRGSRAPGRRTRARGPARGTPRPGPRRPLAGGGPGRRRASGTRPRPAARARSRATPGGRT